MSSNQNQPAGFSNGLNSFARALSEAKGGQPGAMPNGDFSGLAEHFNGENPTQADAEQKLAQGKENEARRAEHFQKFRQEVNLFDQQKVARDQKVAQEIEANRASIRQMLTKPVQHTAPEVDQASFSRITKPESGKYHTSFLHKLRLEANFALKRVQKGEEWKQEWQRKAAQKKNNRFAGQKGHQETKAVHDMAHHEVSNNMGQ